MYRPFGEKLLLHYIMRSLVRCTVAKIMRPTSSKNLQNCGQYLDAGRFQCGLANALFVEDYRQESASFVNRFSASWQLRKEECSEFYSEVAGRSTG